MEDNLTQARENFILGMSRISAFWGFPKAMGAIFGALYLSPTPVSLDELAEQVNVTKGAVSTNVRSLERLGMVHKFDRIGERKDYYTAETDFWKIVKGLLREREKSEFDRAIGSVGESLALLDESDLSTEQAKLASFYRERMNAMQAFFRTLDNLVALALSLDSLRLSAIQKFFGKADGGTEPPAQD